MDLMCHDVIVDNFKTNETIYYSFVIIKGHIEKLKDIHHENCDEIVLISNENTEIFPVIRGNFKILANLRLGENCLKIRYYCNCFEITINYKLKTNGIYTVVPLYIICDGHDGRFQAPSGENNDIHSACNRIDTCCKLLQTIFAEKLYENSFGRKSFNIGGGCKPFYSRLNYLQVAKLKEHELWEILGRELLNSLIIDERYQKILAFLSCTNYRGVDYNPDLHADYNDLLKLIDGYVALSGGGFALFGTPCLFTWPENLQQVLQRFQNNTVIDRRKFFDDSYYRGTYGACFSTTLGSVLHELCHTFDLGHTEQGIMGRGFDNIQTVFVPNGTHPTSRLLENYQSKIEFQEDRQSILANRKHFDENFWTRSCLVILAYHKWFNDFPAVDSYILKYDPITRIITSNKGLRVIELRRDSDGYVTKFWTFENRILKYTFQLPEISEMGDRVVLIVDNIGNILKETIVNKRN